MMVGLVDHIIDQPKMVEVGIDLVDSLPVDHHH
jgi:hypothetical protein